MHINILITLLSALTFGHCIVLKALQIRSASNPIPENVADIYEPRTYSKWQQYHAESASFYIIRFVIDEIMILLMLTANIPGRFMDLFPRGLGWFLLSSALTVFAVMLVSSLFSLHQIQIKEKYGLNKLSRKTFWKKQLRLFTVILMFFLAANSISYFTVNTGHLENYIEFPLFLVFITGPVIIFAILFLPVIILWNTKPLQGKGLQEKLEKILETGGIKNCRIRIKKTDFSAPPNACYFRYFHKQYIILYDTLLLNHSTEEVEGIFAHEVGQAVHYRFIPRLLQITGMLIPLITYVWYLFNLVVTSAVSQIRIDQISLPAVAIILVGQFYLLTAGPALMNLFSRKRAILADEYAADIGYGAALETCLKHIAGTEFEELNPDPLLVCLEWGLPPLNLRISRIENKLSDKPKSLP